MAPEPVDAPDRDAALSLHAITKRFPGVLANDRVSLVFRRGEIHALLGENGAGKSTLIGIVSGMLRPDSGTIEVAGRPSRIASPSAALRLGIGTVYQHVLLVPSLTVLENLMLGGSWWRLNDRDATLKRFRELAELLSVRVSPDAPVGRLSLGEQQQVEIMRALWHGELVLILDEPTSMLTPRGVRDLGVVMRRLRDHGVAIVFITHKLREASDLSDRISVLRQGRVFGELGPETLRASPEGEIIERVVAMMFERDERADDLRDTLVGNAADRRTVTDLDRETAPVLFLRDGHTAGQRGECPLKGAELEVRPGEVLGIAGVDGNGQKHLAEVLAGQRMMTSGSIRLAGRDIQDLGVAQRRRLGVRYITDERLDEGTTPHHSVATNLVIKEIGSPRFWKRGITLWQRIWEHARQAIRTYDIVTPTEKVAIANLSGGNIQKVLLAREWASDARLLIISKPTSGLDLQNTKRARDWIRNNGGRTDTAIVVISNELDELIEVSHRIAVMERGRVAGVVDNRTGARTEIGRLMTGVEAA